MNTEQNINTVYQYWERCWNLHKPDSINQTHHTSFSQNGEVIGVAAFQKSLGSFFESFPDIQVCIEDVLAQGDRVLMRVVYQGTHKGVYEGIPPTSRQISVGGLELFMLVNDKIVHHWHEMDHLEILKQIGVEIPAPSK